MKISKQARRDAKLLFRACQVNGLLDEAKVRQTVTQLAAQRPHGYMAILKLFQRLVKLEVASRTAIIESAVPLEAGEQAAVTERVSKAYGAGLAVNFAPNPALLGGMRIRVGSDVFDGSVRGRLEALKESF